MSTIKRRWVNKFKKQWGFYPICGGKGETQITYPQAPAAPTTAESVKAYTESLPQMYQAQLEYGPKIQAAELAQYMASAPALASIENALQMQYAPGEAEQAWQLQEQYAPKYASQQQELQKLYEPEAAAAKEQLGGIINEGDYMGNAPWMESRASSLRGLQGLTNQDYLTNYNPETAPGLALAKNRLRGDIRGAWADRGLGQSGASAFDESKVLSELELPYAQAQEQMRVQELGRRQSMALGLGQTETGTYESAANRYLGEVGRRQNVGLSLAGRYNVPTQQQISTPQIQANAQPTTNLMQGFNQGNIANTMASNYGTYAQAARPLALQDTRKYGLGWLLSM